MTDIHTQIIIQLFRSKKIICGAAGTQKFKMVTEWQEKKLLSITSILNALNPIKECEKYSFKYFNLFNK